MTTYASSASSGSETPSPTGRVVVGIDGSDQTRATLRWVHFVAATTGSTIEAVAVSQVTTAFGLVGLGWGARPPGWDPAQPTVDTLQPTLEDVFGGRRPLGLVAKVEQGNTAQGPAGPQLGRSDAHRRRPRSRRVRWPVARVGQRGLNGARHVPCLRRPRNDPAPARTEFSS